jgi:hypothetical protein
MRTRAPRILARTGISVAVTLTLLLVGALLWSILATPTARASHSTLSPAACTPGPHGGIITSDQTWCAADSPHVLSETLTVAAGAVLTIEAGTTVQAADYQGLHVLGRLTARGTPTSTITFTVQDTGWKIWQGLAFVGSSASADLQHIIVKMGGHGNSVYGGHAMVLVKEVHPGQVRLADSLVTQPVIPNSGYVFGIDIIDSNFLMSGATVSGASGSGNDTAMSVSGASTVVTLTGNTFVGNGGTTLRVNGVGSASIERNDFHGNDLAMSLAGDNITVSHNQIHDNGGRGLDPRGGISIGSGSPMIAGNVIRKNNPNGNGAVGITGGSPVFVNNVIVGNHATGVSSRCSAMYIYATAGAPIFKHNTIAGNDGGDPGAICISGDGFGGRFYNTIVADEAVGVSFWSAGTIEMSNTLWDNVSTKVAEGTGTLTEYAAVYGKALFDLDGYHLTRQSRAVGMGAPAGVTDDIDGEARPLPVGTNPDIGADEYPFAQAKVFWMEFYAGAPRLEATETGGVQIKQDLDVFWNYGSDATSPPDLPVFVTDTLPAEMEYESEETTGSGGFVFQRDAQQLTWHSQWPAKKDHSGYIRYTITYKNVQPGQAVDNVVHVTAGPNVLSQTISTEIPFFPPKITYPASGETCVLGDTVVAGYAMPSSIVRLYEDGYESTMFTVADTEGRFQFIYASSKAGAALSTEVTVQSCSAANPYDCSKPSNAVQMTQQTSFWCPRRSFWQGQLTTGGHGIDITTFPVRFNFRNNAGQLATDNWIINGGRGFGNTTLSLNLCNCPGDLNYPTGVHVVVSGTTYYSTTGQTVLVFTIPSASGAVEFHGTCGSEIVDHGLILIDPDGYVFDVTQGFDPITPTLHTLAGVTVTLKVHEPDLGGWVQWPAHLYDNQANPQVTASDGYYAFFTPPGRYSVQVAGKNGYQSWRSPVITVTGELVHVNVPLTPISDTTVNLVNLTVTGPDKPVVIVPTGGTVAWAAEMIPNINEASRKQYTENPVLRPLSALDPLTSTLGWDGGMMAPGQIYQRRMDQPGIYLYDDGLGHSGTVLVGNYTSVHLPLVMRQ